MLEHTMIDVRRTEGGLRLVLCAPGAQRWTTRLGYDDAEELIRTIRSEHTCTLHAEPFKHQILSIRTKDCTELDFCGIDADLLANALRAHMPDRMLPFGLHGKF